MRQILEMSVITNSPVPQMQLHTIFTELHVQVSPRAARGGAFSGAGQRRLGTVRGGGLGAGQGRRTRGGSGEAG